MKPSVAVFEEYTDNVFGTETDKKAEFITRTLPGFEIGYKAMFWEWALNYNLDHRYYARDSSEDELTHHLEAKGNLRLIKNFLFLDILESYKRVSLDVNRDRTLDSLFVGQADQNFLTVSPNIVFRPITNVTVNTGYQYVNELYTETGIDKEEHRAFVRATCESSPNLNFSTNLGYAHVMTSHGLDYDQYSPFFGIHHQYANKSFLSLEAGYTWFLYDNGSSGNSPYWNASIIHAFDYLTASLNALTKYNSDPLNNSTEQRTYTGTLERKIAEDGKATLFTSYSELRDTQADLLLSTRFEIGGTIRGRLSENMEGFLNGTAEKVDIKNSSEITPPYGVHISTGIGYSLIKDLTVSLTYMYTTYRESLESAANNIEINRAIVGLTKRFNGVAF